MRGRRSLGVALALWAGAAAAQPVCAPVPASESLAAADRLRWAEAPSAGCWVWRTLPPPAEPRLWTSPCPLGQGEGSGLLTWPSGARYEGGWREGRPHGHGTLTWPNFDRYEGEFLDGRPHGRGILTTGRGARYEGEFREGEPSGRGAARWPNGDSYTGDWAEGRPHGRGDAWASNACARLREVWHRGCVDLGRRGFAQIGRGDAPCP